MRAYLVDCVQNCTLVTQDVEHINVSYLVPDAVTLGSGSKNARNIAGQTQILFGGGMANNAATPMTIDGGAHVLLSLGIISGPPGTVAAGAGTAVELGDAATYDHTAIGFTAKEGGTILLSGAAALWGTSVVAGTFTLKIAASSSLIKRTNTTWVLAIPATSAVQDMVTTSATNPATNQQFCFPFDTGTAAFAGAVALTNVLLDTAPPAGFGGSFTNPVNGCRIVTG